MAQPSPKRRRKRMSECWFELCDRIAFGLVDEHDLPPDLHGLNLVITAVFRRIRASLIPKQVSDTLKRRASERTMDVESRGLGRIIDLLEYFVGSSVHRIQAIGAWIYKLLVPERLLQSAERAMVEKSTDTYESVTSWVGGFVRLCTPLWLRRRLQTYSGPAAACYNFGAAWAKSRTWSKLLWGIPVAIFAIPIVGALAGSLVYSHDQKLDHYRLALERAVEARDENAEAMCLQRLAQLGDRRIERAEFLAAWELANQEGKWDDAVDRMQKLAPLDTPGYAQAHLWLGQHLLQGKIEADDRWEQIEKHAEHALKLTSKRERAAHDQARLLRARVWEQRGQWRKAAEELSELSDQMPSLHFDLMQRAIASRDSQDAKRHARQVISICESLNSESGDATTGADITPLHFRAWAIASQIVEGGERAETVIRMGIQRFPEDPVLASWLSNHIAQNLIGADLDTPESLSLLREVWQLNPDQPTAAKVLTDAALTAPAIARKLTQALLETESIPASVCLTLGDRRWSVSDGSGALWYYQAAAQVDPQSVAAWNNVAWLSGCVEETLDLDLALAAANKAIALDEDPRCFETRGQIYARQEKWPEAIRDLERAVNGSLPDSGPAHETLAKALAAIGDVEAAEAHRRKANLAP